MAMSSTLSSAASTAPLQLGAAEVFSGSRVLLPISQPKRRSPGVGVVNSMPSPQGPNWLFGQCSNIRQTQSGILAGRSSTPYYSHSNLGLASMSKIFSVGSGGGGKGFGGWGSGGGGGGGGGDGFGVPAVGEFSIGASGGESSASITEDVIFLNVGVSGDVLWRLFCICQRILEAQPQVKEATVDLATETAVVQITTEPVAASGWEVIKRELGESLAKHLTSCGFKSVLKEQDGKDGEKVAPAA